MPACSHLEITSSGANVPRGGFVLRAIIFANGQYEFPYCPEPHDLVIAADGGARHCLAHGIQPTVVIGDLDSLRPDELATLETGGAQILTYPARKDHTDLELAIELALQSRRSVCSGRS